MIRSEDKDLLQRTLAEWHGRYDSKEQMIARPFSSPGYHTTLTGGIVHPTRESLVYAVALCESGTSADLARAEEVLRKVISLQDKNPDHDTFGIWPWFLEEPLEQMSPPDWNWADFCGAQLLAVLVEHREKFDSDVVQLVSEAVERAARAIIKRNVGPGYTNIAIMGSYVTLVAGEVLGISEFADYGRARLQRFWEFTKGRDGFTEYNSPTYTVVAIKELARLRMHARDQVAKQLVEELYQFAWGHAARHFHQPTRQWAGPHSRCYRNLSPVELLSFLQRATGVKFLDREELRFSPDDLRLDVTCPAEFVHYYQKPRTTEVLETYASGKPPLAGTTYLTPEYTLGSISIGEMWNQRRNLLAYWGGAEPRYLHLRLLHDGYDYSSGVFFGVQREGCLLGGICFATDGGDRHISLDRIQDGTIRAEDLRLRFEFGGQVDSLSLPQAFRAGESVVVQDGVLYFALQVARASFDKAEIAFEVGRSEENAWLDLVFYSGAEKDIDLRRLQNASVGLALRMGLGEPVPPAVEVKGTELLWPGERLRLQLPVSPAPFRELRDQVRMQRA